MTYHIHVKLPASLRLQCIPAALPVDGRPTAIFRRRRDDFTGIRTVCGPLGNHGFELCVRKLFVSALLPTDRNMVPHRRKVNTNGTFGIDGAHSMGDHCLRQPAPAKDPGSARPLFIRGWLCLLAGGAAQLMPHFTDHWRNVILVRIISAGCVTTIPLISRVERRPKAAAMLRRWCAVM